MSNTNTEYFDASLLAFECIKAETHSRPGHNSQDTDQKQQIASSNRVTSPKVFDSPLFPSGFSFYDVDEEFKYLNK